MFDWSNMKNQLVYDLPLRLFHWIFAALFIAAFTIAKTVDDESVVFSYHMLAGLLLGLVVLLRVIWGFVGTKHSRFSGLALNPYDLVSYFTGVVSGSKKKWSGHNPASSWATLLMFTLALGLGLTGYLMASGQKEAFEDLHELLANGFLIVVLLHVAGVVLHAFRHQDRIVFSMIDGTKENTPISDAIESSRPIVAIVFIGFVATFAVYLTKNFNSQNQTLNFFEIQLQLGDKDATDNLKFEQNKMENDGNEEKDND